MSADVQATQLIGAVVATALVFFSRNIHNELHISHPQVIKMTFLQLIMK